MPAQSDTQARLFRMALAAKKGKLKTRSPKAEKIAKTLTSSKIKEFTRRG